MPEVQVQIGEAEGEVIVGFRSRDEALEVLERTFDAVEADELLGPVLHAAGLREELRLSDLGLVAEIAAGEGGRCLDWSFDSPSFEPRISLTMDSSVANGILQGAESIGVAIARGRMRIDGDAGAALVHLPATRLICRHYLELIRRDYPHLVIR